MAPFLFDVRHELSKLKNEMPLSEVVTNPIIEKRYQTS